MCIYQLSCVCTTLPALSRTGPTGPTARHRAANGTRAARFQGKKDPVPRFVCFYSSQGSALTQRLMLKWNQTMVPGLYRPVRLYFLLRRWKVKVAFHHPSSMPSRPYVHSNQHFDMRKCVAKGSIALSSTATRAVNVAQSLHSLLAVTKTTYIRCMIPPPVISFWPLRISSPGVVFYKGGV